MRRTAFVLLIALAACTPAVVAPSAAPTQTPSPTASPTPLVAETATPVPVTPTPFQNGPPMVQVPMPEVALKAQGFPMGTAPVAQRVPLPQAFVNITANFGSGLISELNGWRRRPPVPDEAWNSRIWPGAFQKIARDAVAAKTDANHSFELDGVVLDSAWALPWNVPTGNATTTALQFIDVTVKFRDHGATLPPDDTAYVWHVRLPVANQNVYAIADGYDGVHASTWMNSTTYWDQSRLEKEATSALAGYLWSESFLKGDYTPQFMSSASGTPFWQSRSDALNDLAKLFGDGRLTDRHFEAAAVRIDSFEPLTVYGGGIVTVTLTGQLVQTLDGKTARVTFDQPMKFFRFANSPVQLAGWTAIDSFEDGAWVSGGNLALDKLSTVHG